MRRPALLSVLLVSFGCAKEPTAPPPGPALEQPPADVAPVSSAFSAASAQPDAAAPETAPPAAPVAIDEPKPDPCVAVSAAFEASLRPKLKKCWLDAANKRPKERIVGSVRYLIEIDSSGKVSSRRQIDKSDLPAPVLDCMLKAVKAEPIDATKCEMKSLTIAEKFPR